MTSVTPPLRILTVVYDLGPGGTQRAAQNYSLGYARRGVPVAVLGWRDGGPREAVLREANLPVFVGADGLRAALAWGPTLLHVHRWGDALVPDEIPLLTRLRASPTRPRVIETNVFGRADRTPTRHLIDIHLQLSAWCLWRWQRWTRSLPAPPVGALVPYAVETDAFRPLPAALRARWRAEHGIPPNAVLYGRVGQPIRWKWHPALLDAFAAVAANQPSAWLLTVGLPPELQPALDALPAWVRSRVVQIPFLHGDEALRLAYASMDVFVHASEIGETFGMVLAEAMLCHTPVVTLSRPARDNSQLEVVQHGVGGLVAATESALAEAMLALGRVPNRRASMGHAGAASIQSRFTIAHVTDLLLDVAERTLSASSRSDLRRRIQESAVVTSTVSDAYIRSLLAQSVGSHRILDLAMMEAIHRPGIHTLWRRLKTFRGEG